MERSRYEQKQPHRLAPSSAPRLFSPRQLQESLENTADAETFLAYEVFPEAALSATAGASLAQFPSAEITLVTLTVGAVITSWALVSLVNPRDLILWKMKYHLRDRPINVRLQPPSIADRALRLESMVWPPASDSS